MILRDKLDRFDGTWQMLVFDADQRGRAVAELKKSDFDREINTFYAQRAKEVERLHGHLFANQISPLAFFMELQSVTVEDAAARMRLRKSVVRSHMTPKGFDRINVATLKRYARIFDLSVADFFQFTRLSGDLDATTRHGEGRLVQDVTVSVSDRPED